MLHLSTDGSATALLYQTPTAFKSRFVTPAAEKTTKTRTNSSRVQRCHFVFSAFYRRMCIMFRVACFYDFTWDCQVVFSLLEFEAKPTQKFREKEDNTRALPSTDHKMPSIRRVMQGLYTVLRELRPATVTTNSEACNL